MAIIKKSLSMILFIFSSFVYADKTSITFNDISLPQNGGPVIKATKLNFFDKSRNRSVPVEIYVNGESEGRNYQPQVVIINHGYSVKSTEYSFIANALAARGYFVVSIQHDLESDPVLPRTGNLFQRRKPRWERGVQNILFTMTEIKKTNSNLDFDRVILIGHSNGGDISMMFTEVHPGKVKKVISLDSLRYPFPADKNVPILHFGASDTKADPGVIPAKGVETITVQGAKHIDLCDRGGSLINQEVFESIAHFLK